MKYADFMAKGQSSGVVITDGSGRYSLGFPHYFSSSFGSDAEYLFRGPKCRTRFQSIMDLRVQEDKCVRGVGTGYGSDVVRHC